MFATKHSKEWSCASCHHAMPTAVGKYASASKVITPLAPAINPKRFTDSGKAEKWVGHNCNDVMGRECTAEEKQCTGLAHHAQALKRE